MNLPGAPTADGSAAVQKHLQEPDDPGVMDIDAGVRVLMEGDAGAFEFPVDEGVAVEPVGGVEGKEAGHANLTAAFPPV